MIEIRPLEMNRRDINAIPGSTYFTGTIHGRYGLYLKSDNGSIVVSLTDPGQEMPNVKEVFGYKKVDPKHNILKTKITIEDIPVGTVFTGSLCKGDYNGVFLKCSEGGIVMLFGKGINYSWGVWQKDVEVSCYKEIDIKLDI